MPKPQEARFETARKLFELFKPERFVNLALNTVAFLLLLTAAGWMLYDGVANKTPPDAAALTLLLGSTGLVTATSSRLLRMWSDMIRIIFEEDNKEGS